MTLVLAAILVLSVGLETEITKNKFGNVEYTIATDDLSEKEVYFPDDSLYYDNWLRTEYLLDSLEQAKSNKEKMDKGTIYKCGDNTHPDDDFFQFLPAYVGALKKNSETITYEGHCFKRLKFKMEYLPNIETATEVKMTITAHGKKSLLCREHLFLSSTDRHHIEPIFLPRKHTVTFKNLDADDMDDIRLDGIRMYAFCHGVVNEFVSVFNTLKLFLGGIGSNPKYPIIGSHVPKYMEKANVKFLEESMGWKMEKRAKEHVYIPDENFPDGTFLSITRLDGLDEIIMWGTGSHSGHSVVVVTIDEEKYVVESQDGWYWPKGDIQRTPLRDWIRYADNADMHVAVLPLSKKYQDKFDNDAAVEWFKTLEGYPYGYHNFLFSWLDTPEDNLPSLLPHELLPIAFDMVEHLMPSVASQMFGEAMNKRLGTEGLNMKQIAAEAAHRNMTIQDLYAIPEDDDWIYSDGPSYVCSCLVAGVWKAGGVFDDMPIQANEWSPKDVYQVKIFDEETPLPKACAQNDPDLPYCQILGKYKLTLPGFNTVEPYPHMNEHCRSLDIEDYYRPDGC